MKKVITSAILFACVLGLSSCGMKECKCFSSNKVMQNDSIIEYSTDTVSNYTRNTCEEFNQEETIYMDSVKVVHHTITCMDN